WLSDVIFAALHGIWGLKSIAMLAGVVVCCAATAVFCHMLWSGGSLFISLAVALVVNGASSVHFLPRPHVFTVFLLAASLWILARDRREPDLLVWLLAPITAVWVNLHGGFLALIVCLGLTVAGYGLRWLLDRAPADLRCLKRYTILSAVCGL